ncbi:MAG: Na-translocating system protein MpsC family protein [Peptococcaceae bacterium]|mgnify:CR=1 FL=1|nr:Na-translocating system protein MpsC family protein [Peptococcaceae bacterium]
MLLGKFKQKILVCHNKVNLQVLGQGLQKQKIELLEDKAIITAINRRLPSLTVLESFDELTAKTLEVALIIRLKEALRKEIETELGIEVFAVLKDYDKVTETSVVVIIFKEKAEDVAAKAAE